MSKDGQKNRLSKLEQIPSFAAMDHRNQLDKDGNHKLLSNLSRKDQRKIKAEGKKLGKKYSKIQKRNKESGTGFPVDQLLRELVIEFTHRYASSGVFNQPVRFNYFEPFCKISLIEEVAPYAEPRNEVDHLFSITDYFDYLTSDASDNFDLSSLTELIEGKVLHFSRNGDILDFSFLNSEGREFVISGFSMVRWGSSLHWYLLGGEILSDEEWKLRSTDQRKIKIEDIAPHKRAFIKEMMEKNGSNIGAPIALEGTKTAIRTIITGEIDLKTKKYLGRCLMTETENMFNLECDDPEIFNPVFDSKKKQTMINLMREKIGQAAVMWDLVGSMFQLPSYFAYKVHVKKEIVVAAGKRVRKIKPGGGKGLGARYKNVSSIEIIESNTPVIRSIVPPHYKTETDGHWRRLPYGSTGKGPDGSEENGRTWIKAKSEWREEPETLRTIYVKSAVGAAKLKASEYEKAAQSIQETIKEGNLDPKTESGELYVLRCLLMKEELYKVGWTSDSSERRAEQLSAVTGVPSSFTVVDSWKHNDAEALEKSVHAMLDPYRCNDRREFFLANYCSIKKIIEAEIERFSSKQKTQ